MQLVVWLSELQQVAIGNRKFIKIHSNGILAVNIWVIFEQSKVKENKQQPVKQAKRKTLLCKYFLCCQLFYLTYKILSVTMIISKIIRGFFNIKWY